MKRKTVTDLERELRIEKHARTNAELENARLRRLFDDQDIQFSNRVDEITGRVATLEESLHEAEKSLSGYSKAAVMIITKAYQMSMEMDEALMDMAGYGSAHGSAHDAFCVAFRDATKTNRQIRQSLEMIAKLPLNKNNTSLIAEHIVGVLIGKEGSS